MAKSNLQAKIECRMTPWRKSVLYTGVILQMVCGKTKEQALAWGVNKISSWVTVKV